MIRHECIVHKYMHTLTGLPLPPHSPTWESEEGWRGGRRSREQKKVQTFEKSVILGEISSNFAKTDDFCAKMSKVEGVNRAPSKRKPRLGSTF